MEPRRGLAVFLAALSSLALFAAASQAADCGAHEDAERASHRTLTWDDFQGPPPPGAARGASPHAPSIKLHSSLRIDALAVATEPVAGGAFSAHVAHVCVRAYALKQLSGRPRSAVLTWQLEHEQGHFDLTQAHAQRLRERLAALTGEGATAAAAEQSLRDAARAAYRDAMRQLQAEQDRYDRETRHGNHRARQAKWKRALAGEIAPPQRAGGVAVAARDPE
jgi:hypothetical protein